ncbi:hypothetical protein PAL_GLEAN10014584 [Pteropus alecto]|uniref:Uncharacterized protein n=1 Tax=Pteropus alecto TaxID=9402 RepID=L5KL42_PTEAL|nr:hypothetical protein PAL_GLEAN10014584 [Pteropus alecto]
MHPHSHPLTQMPHVPSSFHHVKGLVTNPLSGRAGPAEHRHGATYAGTLARFSRLLMLRSLSNSSTDHVYQQISPSDGSSYFQWVCTWWPPCLAPDPWGRPGEASHKHLCMVPAGLPENGPPCPAISTSPRPPPPALPPTARLNSILAAVPDEGAPGSRPRTRVALP